MSPLGRSGATVALSALIALGVALAGSAGLHGRAQARMQGLDQRMGQRLDRMERRQSLLHADVAHQARVIAAAAPRATAGGATAVAAGVAEQTVQPAVVEASAEAQSAAAPSHPLLGDWRCSFRQQEHSYPPMPCRISRKDGGLFLEKTHGSQRIKGTVTQQGQDRFQFSGLYFCPFGSCDERVSGTFERKSRDHWVGKLRDGGFGTVVTLRRPSAPSASRNAAPAPTRSAEPAKTRAATTVLSPFD